MPGAVVVVPVAASTPVTASLRPGGRAEPERRVLTGTPAGAPSSDVRISGQMGTVDELLANNDRYAANFDKGALRASPRRKVAVLACMDARLDPARALGLEEGDAHVVRNAGGVATEDAIRSLVISQHLLGTEEVVLLHHTDCGMESFTDDELRERLEDQTGVRPGFSFEAFAKAEDDLVQTAARLQASPFLAHKQIRAFLYEVETGRLREVPLP